MANKVSIPYDVQDLLAFTSLRWQACVLRAGVTDEEDTSRLTVKLAS